LPTEAEWECACRGESSTAYSFGESLELLEKYAWFGGNSLSAAHPVGILKPNDLGLSDMHSNILEWCEDQYSENDTNGRVLRGGSFLNQAVSVRSASRFSSMLANRTINDGFRPTRTFR
jgi:formylglycine-generating enzyme required for sulfatase activity